MSSSHKLSVWTPKYPGGILSQLQSLKVVIFDLDGTLADTQPVITATLVELLDRQSRTVSNDVIAALLPQGFPTFLAPLGLTSARDQYWQTYKQHARQVKFFPWAIPLLRILCVQGIRIGVQTAVPTHVAKAVLAGAGATDLIDMLIGAGDAPPKPDPSGIVYLLDTFGVSPKDAAMVGDSPTDVQAAQNAGCLSVGVGWGFYPLLALAEAKADVTFTTGEALTAWFQPVDTVPTFVQCSKIGTAQHSLAFANLLPTPILLCQGCAEPITSGALCKHCKQREAQHENWVSSVRCAWLCTEGSPLATAIHQFKGVVGTANQMLALPLGRYMLAASIAHQTTYTADNAIDHPLSGVIVPVPSSSASRRTRGFSPVEQLLFSFFSPLLSESLIHRNTAPTLASLRMMHAYWSSVCNEISASGTGWTIVNALEKIEATELKQQDGDERARIALRAYRMRLECATKVEGQDVYLVEDLITTGATIQACAKLLRGAGAKSVHVITLARWYRLQSNTTQIRCPKCAQGILKQRSRKSDGKPFYSCSRWRRNNAQSCTYTCEVDQIEQIKCATI